MVRNILKRFTLVAVSIDSHFGTSFPFPLRHIEFTHRALRGEGYGDWGRTGRDPINADFDGVEARVKICKSQKLDRIGVG